MWFKKKKDDENTYVKTTSFDDLKTDIKNSKEEPTFILEGDWQYTRSFLTSLGSEYIYKIYLYVDKEE